MRHYPDFVRVFHTSSPLRSVELSKERQRLLGWGKSAKKCDIILTLLCQTIPHFLPFPYQTTQRLASLAHFFSPTPVFSPFCPNAEPGPRLLGFQIVILQNCSKFFCYNLLESSSHSQCPPYLL